MFVGILLGARGIFMEKRTENVPKQFAKFTLGLTENHCLLSDPLSILNSFRNHTNTETFANCSMRNARHPIETENTPHSSNSISFGKQLNVMNLNFTLYQLARMKYQVSMCNNVNHSKILNASLTLAGILLKFDGYLLFIICHSISN